MARRILILILLIGGAIALAQVARDTAGIELSADSVESWVSRFGWQAPAAYLGLVALRHLLLLPSTVLLTAGGLCFGVVLGGALGAIGLVLTGVIEFTILRTIRPQWLLRQAERQVGGFARALRRGTPALLAVSTAVPPMPMSTFHWAAAFTPISLPVFLLVLCIGSAIRSYVLALLGSGLLAEDPSRVVIGSVALVLLLALPLLHRPLRERLFPAAGSDESGG